MRAIADFQTETFDAWLELRCGFFFAVRVSGREVYRERLCSEDVAAEKIERLFFVWLSSLRTLH